jgi:hypothetical protein
MTNEVQTQRLDSETQRGQINKVCFTVSRFITQIASQVDYQRFDHLQKLLNLKAEDNLLECLDLIFD